MKYHNNAVGFFCPGSEFSICGGSFTVESHYVTKGQDPDGEITDGLKKTINDKGGLSFRVGRKGSEETAKWFNKKIDADATTFGHTAGKLNFAFIGKLVLIFTGGIMGGKEIPYTFENIAIAQGHTGASNNWWFGGKECINHGFNAVSVEDTEGHLFLFRRGHNFDKNIVAGLEALAERMSNRHDISTIKLTIFDPLKKSAQELGGYGIRANEIFVRPLILL